MYIVILYVHLICVLISSLRQNTLYIFDSLTIYQEMGLYRKRERNKHANSDKQPILIVAENRCKYDTILQLIRAEDYL